MQNARRKMLGVHSGKIFLQPVVLESPFRDQKTGTSPAADNAIQFREGAD
jgi:hypothetical protein